MILTATDATESGIGWHVTVQSSDFVYSGPNGGAHISAAMFSIVSSAAPKMTAGQIVDATGGPKVPAGNAIGTLNQARTVLGAATGFGAGTYTQDLDVTLSVPSQSRVGTYTGTLTVTMAVNP